MKPNFHFLAALMSFSGMCHAGIVAYCGTTLTHSNTPAWTIRASGNATVAFSHASVGSFTPGFAFSNGWIEEGYEAFACPRQNLGAVNNWDTDSGDPCLSVPIDASSSTISDEASGVAAISVSECFNVDYSATSQYSIGDYVIQTVGPNDTCREIGDCHWHDGVSAYNVSIRTYDFGSGSNSLSYTRTFNMQNQFRISYGNDCHLEVCSGQGLTAYPVAVDFASDTFQLIYANNDQFLDVSQALVISMSDGTTLRYGFATGSDFAPVATGGGYDIDGTMEITLTPPTGNMASARTAQETDSITKFDGDLDGDRLFRWFDRRGISMRLGVSFDDESYTPRADLNLDRLIDGSELSMYNTLHCPADVDDGTSTGTPDGGVQIDDLLYYLDLFGDGSIQADLDDGTSTGAADGGVQIDDLLFFLERFENGC